MSKYRKGAKFGRLVILERLEEKDSSNSKLCLCLCECGKEVKKTVNSLNNSVVASCGCYASESRSRNMRELFLKHGRKSTPEYTSWYGMKRRCCDKNHPSYSNYGGRGIQVCERWENSFENFYEDMGDKPRKDYSLDRIDLNQNYTPQNCRWASRSMQSRNTRLVQNSSIKLRNGSYVARFTLPSGKRVSKSFSIKKYGKELAELCASEFKDKYDEMIINEINKGEINVYT